MRDQRWVAEHRGGPLNIEQHRQLMIWGCACAEHVLPLLEGELDPRLSKALVIAKAWAQGKATVGEARTASVACHAFARESTNPVTIAIARAVGHAVATAHMADHSLGPALYALKAMSLAGQSIDAERQWQNQQLPPEIQELVLSTRISKENQFKLTLSAFSPSNSIISINKTP